MRNTTAVGDLSVAMVTGALLRAGKNVLKPLSDGLRYDLAIEEAGALSRIQCKTGRLRRGAIIFNTASVTANGKRSRGYDGDAEFFGVFCPETDEVYLVPIAATAKVKGRLRFTVPRNNQAKRILYASTFKI
jgi:hypothetical protein